MKKETAKLKRISGQINALARMVESGDDCNEVITQFLAAKSALDSVFTDVLNNNLDRCLRKGGRAELKKIIKQISKR